MKKTILLILTGFFALNTFAQKLKEKELPQPVLTAFQKAYPSVKNAKWEKEKDNYEAEFKLYKNEYSVLFDNNGNIIETEIDIELSELPKQITDYINTNYNSEKIKEASKITKANQEIMYEIELKGKELFFDKNGSFIKEVKD